jgi:hypothetical protein
MEVSLKFTADEINFIQQVLGELPSKSGAFLLMQKIKLQMDSTANTQIPQVQL